MPHAAPTDRIAFAPVAGGARRAVFGGVGEDGEFAVELHLQTVEMLGEYSAVSHSASVHCVSAVVAARAQDARQKI